MANQPHLRPGSTAQHLPLWLRRFRVEVLLWAFRAARPIDARALTVVLGAKQACEDVPFDQWTRHDVRDLVWVGIPRWCADHHLPVPPAAACVLWTLLDHLAATDAFAAGSDPLALLREPLIDSAGVDRRGRPRANHPSLHRAGR